MTLPLALMIIGLGLLGAAALMWRSRKEATRVARALGEVRLAKASEATSGEVCAVWGRAIVGSETPEPDPVTGRGMAWWDLRVARTTPEGTRPVYEASSGGSFLVADDSGAVRVPAASVDLRLSGVFVDYDGVPGPLVQRYLNTLELEAEQYAITARHRFLPLDTELLVVGRFVHEEGGNGSAARGAPTVVGGSGQVPLVTTADLDTLQEREKEEARHHAVLTGRIAVIGAAFLLMAVAASLT